MNKYVEAQNKWVAEVGLKVGDTVLIVANIDGGEGCSTGPITRLDDFVGTEQVVADIQNRDDYNGIRCGTWWYPFCALIKK